jgi:predicted ArsR family transcriptional regulator
MAQGLIVREKVAKNSYGRPKFAYHVPSKTTKQVAVALQDPNVELVALLFSRLRHVCRFENAATARRQKGATRLKSLPKHENKNYNHLHQLRDKPARFCVS